MNFIGALWWKRGMQRVFRITERVCGRWPANMAHTRQSRPYYGLGFQLKVLETMKVVLVSFGSGMESELTSWLCGTHPVNVVAGNSLGSRDG